MDLKTIAWTVLVTAASAATAALTLRVARYGWERVMHEPPPHPPRWVKWGSGALRSKLARTAEPRGA